MNNQSLQRRPIDSVTIRFFPPFFVHTSVISGYFRQQPSRPCVISCDHCCCSRWRVGGVAWRGHLRVGRNKSAASGALERRRAPVSVRTKAARCFWTCDAAAEAVGLFGANPEETKRSWRRGAFIAGWREGSRVCVWETWQTCSLRTSWRSLENRNDGTTPCFWSQMFKLCHTVNYLRNVCAVFFL